jgi:FemAB-related protein (PEP-CTERM system-associated)
VDILVLNNHNRKEWDEFVRECPAASHFHLSGWGSILKEAFGHNPYYLFAKDGDRIRGILPLIPIDSRLSGRYVTSLPGGICSLDEEAADLLIQAAVEFVKSVQASYLILRDGYQKWESHDLVTNDDHCTLLVELDEDPDKLWCSVNRRTRQSINKAYQADLRVIHGNNHLQDFYPIYLQALQERGTPTQGLKYFKQLIEEFPSIFDIFVVHRNEQIFGGGFVALFKDTIYNTWSGTPRKFYDFHTSYILYWETIKYGCNNGYHWLDLGRSLKNSGVFTFKNQWRGELVPLYQQFYLNGISNPPAVGNQRNSHIQYRIFFEVWKHLPAYFTELLGSQIRQRMPFG